MFATPSQVSILSVSKLNRFAKRVLESEIGLVWVSGEVSNFVAASSGHWYFTLKDSQAQVRTAMFKGANQRAGFTPKAGDNVVVRANISLYEPRGDYQLIAQHIEPEGIGQLKQAYEALKAQLQAEGLFDQSTKKPLPPTVSRVGVVTSPTGAAIHDILHVLARRNPAIEVIIYPSLVQGEQASASIAKQIALANQRNEVDVLIVGRGGGSLEDLWPFNEEIVARAIFASNLPIVSAVGHEVDVTIADFVADMRAPTPSAAAENISTDSQVLRHNIERLIHSLRQNIRQSFIQQSQRLDIARANFQSVSVERRIQQQLQRLDALKKRLSNSHPQANIKQQLKTTQTLLNRLIHASHSELKHADQRFKGGLLQLKQCNPNSEIQQKLTHLAQLHQRLVRNQRNTLEERGKALQSTAALLHSVSPLATLARGYSITYHNEEILRDTSQLAPGDIVHTKLSKGEITAKVVSKTGK